MRSLFVRLLTSSAVVAVCSISATAWLAASSTSGAIQREQGQTLASDAQINNTLLGYASSRTGPASLRPYATSPPATAAASR